MSVLTPGTRYGLYAVAGMAVWLALAYVTGLHSRFVHFSRFADWGTELVLIFALWRLLRHQVGAHHRYWLPVWQGLLHGLYASLIAALGYYVLFSFYLHFVNPDYPDWYLEWRVASLRAAGRPEESVRNLARAYRWSLGPVGLPLSTISYYLLVGFIASPLLTLWLNWRRKEPARIS